MQTSQLLAQEDREAYGQGQYRRPLTSCGHQEHPNKSSEQIAEHDVSRLGRGLAG